MQIVTYANGMTHFMKIREAHLPNLDKPTLAVAVEMPFSTLYRIESGEVDPSYKNLSKLRTFYKANIKGWKDSWLFDGLDDKNRAPP